MCFSKHYMQLERVWVLIRTVDTDVSVITFGMFLKLQLYELCIRFGTGKNQRLLSILCLMVLEVKNGMLYHSSMPLQALSKPHFLLGKVKKQHGGHGSNTQR